MKATEGGLAPGTTDANAIKWFGLDPDFRANWANAKAAGLVRGAYHFGRPDLGNTPEAEADWFWSIVGRSLEPGDLLALDLESGAGDLHAWASRFLARVKAHAGFNPMFYASPAFLAAHNLSYRTIGGDYGLWEAFWTSKLPLPAAGWPVIAIWQYGSTTLAGINGKIDGDLFNGDVATLRKYGKPGLFGDKPGTLPAPAPKPVPAPVPTPAPSPTPAGTPIVVHDHADAPGYSNGGPMADSSTAPVVPVPDIPEPSAVAEAGISTSEWKLAIAYLTQAFAAATLDAVNTVSASVFHTSVSIPPALLDLAVKLEWAGALVAASYIVSRGIRKFGIR